jgi:hypothetical protein
MQTSSDQMEKVSCWQESARQNFTDTAFYITSVSLCLLVCWPADASIKEFLSQFSLWHISFSVWTVRGVISCCSLGGYMTYEIMSPYLENYFVPNPTNSLPHISLMEKNIWTPDRERSRMFVPHTHTHTHQSLSSRSLAILDLRYSVSQL